MVAIERSHQHLISCIVASQTYKTQALVLKKTKLGEKDLIISFLDKSGALFQGVAKGARKPGGSFAARLELFSTVDVLMAKGRSLDIVCEARLAGGKKAVAPSLVQSACSSPLAELLGTIAQPGLEQPRLYDLSRAAFNALAAHAEEDAQALAILTASLWKVMSQTGYRPTLNACSLCARSVAFEDVSGTVPFSALEGGVVCDACTRPSDIILIERRTVLWCSALIQSRFDEILTYEMDVATSFSLLHLAQLWIRAHTGRALKSLDFLFTTGLF